ncbi:Putative permease [Klebsiella aerogenes]|nr:Putative permease [Klebsiella aerogenes]
MSGLKQELGLGQGVGLLSTSLLGTGVFAVPALAALVAGDNSLWAWPALILLVFPIAIVFAVLGRHFPSAGGVAHFVDMAFGPRLARVTGWLFLSVIPVGLPAALHIATGFGQALFGWHDTQLLLAELGTLAIVWWVGSRGASSSANLQTLVAVMIVALIVAIWWRGGINPAQIPFPEPKDVDTSQLFAALSVMFWCFVGLEAFAHLASEFKRPERDFPRALMIGLLLAGTVYWGCTVVVLHFRAFGAEMAAAASLPNIVVRLFGVQGAVGRLRDRLSRLLRQPQYLYPKFCPPGLVAGAVQAGRLSGPPVAASGTAQCAECGLRLLRTQYAVHLLAEH